MTKTATKVPVEKVSRASRPKEASPDVMAHPLQSLRHRVDQLFDEFGSMTRWPLFSRLPFDTGSIWGENWGIGTMPAVDVTEKDDAFELTAELPGIDAKDLEIKVINGSLVVKGEKSEQKEEKEKHYHLSERRYGSFERSFTLPESADTDRIEATFSKGVLILSIPKRAEAVTPEKKIPIKAA